MPDQTTNAGQTAGNYRPGDYYPRPTFVRWLDDNAEIAKLRALLDASEKRETYYRNQIHSLLAAKALLEQNKVEFGNRIFKLLLDLEASNAVLEKQRQARAAKSLGQIAFEAGHANDWFNMDPDEQHLFELSATAAVKAAAERAPK